MRWSRVPVFRRFLTSTADINDAGQGHTPAALTGRGNSRRQQPEGTSIELLMRWSITTRLAGPGGQQQCRVAEAGAGIAGHTRAGSVGAPAIVADCRRLRSSGRRVTQRQVRPMADGQPRSKKMPIGTCTDRGEPAPVARLPPAEPRVEITNRPTRRWPRGA